MDSLAIALGIFYIKDTSALNTIKREWQFLESMDLYECGYDFIFYLCRENEIVEVLKLNIYCNSLTSNNGIAYEFDSEKLALLKNNTATLEKCVFNFSTREQAIKSVDSLSQDSSNFIPEKDNLDWYSSEGHFMFDYTFDPKFKPDLDTLIINLEVEIKNRYPNERFKIEHCGSSPWGSCSFRIYSSETLFRKFDLYETVMGFFEYKSFRLEVYKKTTYNKT